MARGRLWGHEKLWMSCGIHARGLLKGGFAREDPTPHGEVHPADIFSSASIFQLGCGPPRGPLKTSCTENNFVQKHPTWAKIHLGPQGFSVWFEHPECLPPPGGGVKKRGVAPAGRQLVPKMAQFQIRLGWDSFG